MNTINETNMLKNIAALKENYAEIMISDIVDETEPLKQQREGIRLLKTIESKGFGVFMKGTHGYKSRVLINPEYDCRLIAKFMLGETPDAPLSQDKKVPRNNQVTTGSEKRPKQLVKVTLPLSRKDSRSVTAILPEDISEEEWDLFKKFLKVNLGLQFET